ncbi:MAG: hypothetical protein AAF721_04215 [Myxococcota bacterium]
MTAGLTSTCRALFAALTVACSSATAVDAGVGQIPNAGTVTEPAVSARIATALAPSLVYLRNEGEGWIEEHACASCHQIPAMLWSLGLAEQRGLAVDADALARSRAWATRDLQKPDADNIHGVSQAIVAGAVPSAELIGLVASARQENGRWTPQGQLPGQRRDAEDTEEVATMWAALAMHTAGAEPGSWATTRTLVEQWVEAPEPGRSNEHAMMRLLLADALHQEFRERATADLLAQQRNDGGWSWLPGEPSDALATGQTLFALRQAGATESSAVQAGVEFLLRTQRDDGTWSVPSTLAEPDGEAHPTADYWGTAWAVTGLLR